MTNDRLPENPVVSVLCTTYNHRDYIGEAIEGVLAQRTDFPIELIVRDDASTDGTREVVDAYARRHLGLIRAVLEPENRYRQGIRPLQAALAHARGEFIAVCEGDDLWTDPSKLQMQVDLLRSRPQVGLVHTDFDDLVRRGQGWVRVPDHRRREGRVIPAGRVFEILLSGNFIQTCTVCLRADAARAFYASGLPISEYPVGDWPLFLHVAALHDIEFLSQSTAAYRKTPGSMMNSGASVRARTTAAYLPMIKGLCAWAGASDRARKFAEVPIWRLLFWYSLEADDLELFESTVEWIDANDHAFLRPLHKRWVRTLGRWRVPRNLIRSLYGWHRQRREQDSGSGDAGRFAGPRESPEDRVERRPAP